MSHGNLGDTHTIRHFGKMSSYAYMKNRQTRVSLAMCGQVMTMMLLDG